MQHFGNEQQAVVYGKFFVTAFLFICTSSVAMSPSFDPLQHNLLRTKNIEAFTNLVSAGIRSKDNNVCRKIFQHKPSYISLQDIHTLLNTPIGNYQSLLTRAVCESTPEIVRLLVHQGANVNGITIIEKDRTILLSPIFHAIWCKKTRNLRQLLKLSAHTEQTDQYGATPLFHAIVHAPVCAHALINKGARVIHRDTYGNTPLHIAAYYGRKKLTYDILHRAAKTITQGHSYDREYINATNNAGKTPIFCAWNSPDPESVAVLAILIRHGANIDIKDRSNPPVSVADLAWREIKNQKFLQKQLIVRSAWCKKQFGMVPTNVTIPGDTHIFIASV